jgi:hypothetical protein
VADFAARHQRIVGTCPQDHCTRRVVLVPAELQRQGLDRLSMADVMRLHRCHRIGGCPLSFHNEAPQSPLTLAHLRGKPFVRVRVRCRGNGCRYYRVWRAEEMIAGLAKRRQGDDHTELFGLGAKMTSPCPVCKRANWAVDVLWIDTDTMGWKARGESWFDELAARPARD